MSEDIMENMTSNKILESYKSNDDEETGDVVDEEDDGNDDK